MDNIYKLLIAHCEWEIKASKIIRKWYFIGFVVNFLILFLVLVFVIALLLLWAWVSA